MAKQVTQEDQVDIDASEPRQRGNTQPMVAIPHYGPGNQEPQYVEMGTLPSAVATRKPSYHPYTWEPANRVLDIVDSVSGGRADWFQRLFSYLLVGGFAAITNLIVFAIVLHTPFTTNDFLHNLVAFLLATEISIFANFIPNDRITFSHLPGHERSWWARCLRFHMTCIAGTVLTYIIQFALHYLAHQQQLVAQAVALIVVTAFNFAFHHIFTYRHTKEAPIVI